MKKEVMTATVLIVVMFLAACAPAEQAEPTPSTNDITVTIEDVHPDQPLAPGIVVLHTPEASLNFEGQLAPLSLERLAEIGDPSLLAEMARGLPGVIAVQTAEAPLHPGESASFDFEVPSDGLVVSALFMMAATNDAYAIADGVPATPGSHDAVNHDAGTEANEPVFSGFDGGQPDPERGEENIENGEPTEEVVGPSDQITDTAMRVVIS